MSKISVVIITCNEEKNIERCLLSIRDIADEIVVVDSFSTDRTEEICRKYNVKFFQHEFLGHIEQKNFAITKARYPHILSLDADEALSPELKKSISNVKENWKYDGYYFNRLTNYCGKWIKHGSWYPARKLRLWDSRKGKWSGLNPHDKFILKSRSKRKYLKGDLLHYSYYSINEHIQQINKFTDILAESFFKNGERVNYFRIVFSPLWRFFRDFFLMLGFLDGFYGLIICVNSSHETFLKYAKLRKLIRLHLQQAKDKICFFNSMKSWGGGEKWHFDVSTNLAYKGYSTFLITNKKSELKNRIRDFGLLSYNVKVSNLSFLNIFKILKISRILKKEKVNTIIMNLSADLKVGGIAAKLAGIPHIIYRRGSAIPIRNTILNRFLFQKILTEVITNSEETKRMILSKNPRLIETRKIKVVYNGIDIEKYDKLAVPPLYIRKKGEIILGNAGRLVRQKAQNCLIDIAHTLKQNGYKFKILIAGEGRLEKELKTYAKRKGVENEVIFLGFVDNIKAFMKSIDVFVLTSFWEGFGYVIIEAMVCRKPVVAFDVSSNPELVEDNKTGFLIENQNINVFIKRIEALMMNRKLRQQMGQKGRKKVESSFDFEKTLNNVEEIIKK
jgi:glycosyltransferase involved in cell wall biosynthesis